MGERKGGVSNCGFQHSLHSIDANYKLCNMQANYQLYLLSHPSPFCVRNHANAALLSRSVVYTLIHAFSHYQADELANELDNKQIEI